MGAGEIFRAVAQGLMGAGSGAAKYALDRDSESRKQQYLLQALAAQAKGGYMSPLEQEKVRAEINNLNRRNTGGDGAGKTKTLFVINDKTGSLRSVFAPENAGDSVQLYEGERVLNSSGGGFREPAPGVDDILSQLQGGNSNAPSRPPMPTSTATPPVSAPSITPSPSPASLPPRRAGETQDQYSARTGIRFK